MQLPLHTDILVTSKDTDWPTKLSLSDQEYALTQDEGIEILKKWIGKARFDRSEAEKIAVRFCNLPTAIAQAGHYIAQAKTMPMSEYLPLFEAKKREILSKGKHPGQPIDIVVSLRLSMEKLDVVALELLLYCAYLPGKNIPTDLLLKLCGTDQGELNDRLSSLQTLVISDTNRVTIHDLFQELIVEDKSPTEKYLSKLAKVSIDFSEFLKTDPSKAIPIFQQGLKEAEKQRNNKEIARFSNQLGHLYRDLVKYDEALRYHQKALETRRKVLGEDHPSTAASYNNVGMSFGDLGAHQKALQYLQKGLEIHRKILGKDHLDTAISYNNMGGCLRDLGRHQEALQYTQRALEIYRTVLGEGHPDTAISYNNMGGCLRDLGRHQEALQYTQKALEIYRTVFGEDLPNTATSYDNVGDSFRSLGHHQKALQYKQKALDIRQKVLGEGHPDTAISYNNVGSSYQDLGHPQEALQYMQKALEIYRTVLGEDHPDTAMSYNNVGISLRDLGDHQEASQYLQKALEIQRKVLGEDHPTTALSYNNVGMSFGDLGDYQNASQYLQKGLEIHRKVLGEDHPNTAISYNNVGMSLRDLGRHQEAIDYIKKAFIISCKHVPGGHFSQKTFLEHLTNCLKDEPDTQLCLKVREEIFPLAVEKFGKNDPLIREFEQACSTRARGQITKQKKSTLS